MTKKTQEELRDHIASKLAERFGKKKKKGKGGKRGKEESERHEIR